MRLARRDEDDRQVGVLQPREKQLARLLRGAARLEQQRVVLRWPQQHGVGTGAHSQLCAKVRHLGRLELRDDDAVVALVLRQVAAVWLLPRLHADLGDGGRAHTLLQALLILRRPLARRRAALLLLSLLLLSLLLLSLLLLLRASSGCVVLVALLAARLTTRALLAARLTIRALLAARLAIRGPRRVAQRAAVVDHVVVALLAARLTIRALLAARLTIRVAHRAHRPCLLDHVAPLRLARPLASALPRNRRLGARALA